MASGLDIGLSNTSLKTVTLSFYSSVPSRFSPDQPIPEMLIFMSYIFFISLLQTIHENKSINSSLSSHVQVVIFSICATICIPFQAGKTNVQINRHHPIDHGGCGLDGLIGDPV
jgi:hypothetical protein